MISEDKARPYFENYMRNLTIKVDRSESGKYTDDRVETSWLDYLCGWVHGSLFITNDERVNLQKQLDEIRGSP